MSFACKHLNALGRCTGAQELPDELWSKLFEYCDFDAKLLALPLVCRRFNKLLSNPVQNVWGTLTLQIQNTSAYGLVVRMLVANCDPCGKLRSCVNDPEMLVVTGTCGKLRSYVNDPEKLVQWILQRARGFSGLRLVIFNPLKYPGDPAMFGAEPLPFGSPAVWKFLVGCFPVALCGMQPTTFEVIFKPTPDFGHEDAPLVYEHNTYVVPPLLEAFGKHCGSSFERLHSAVISNCQTDDFTSGLLLGGAASKLRSLHLDDCHLGWPTGLVHLPQLLSLRLTRIGIGVASFSCPSLTSLQLLGCEWEAFPSWISGSPLLQVLEVVGTACDRETFLGMSEEEIDALAMTKLDLMAVSEQWATFLPQLKVLTLQSCSIRILPKYFTTCSALQRLSLQHNYMSILSPCIAALSSLQHLDLSRNRLNHINMKFLSELTALTRLDMGNQMHSGFQIPHPMKELLTLTRLEELVLPDLRPKAAPPNRSMPCWRPEDVPAVLKSGTHIGHFVMELRRLQAQAARPPVKFKQC